MRSMERRLGQARKIRHPVRVHHGHCGRREWTGRGGPDSLTRSKRPECREEQSRCNSDVGILSISVF
jgi:hypothetical protein